MRNERLTRLAFAAVVVMVAARVCFGQAWWNEDWQCRRTVEVDPPALARPGEEAALVSFTTGGHLRSDGADIRIVAGDEILPHKVVFIGPGDRVSLLFRVMPGRTRYHAYYGNPNAKAPETDWTPQRGLVLETRPYRGGQCRNWNEMSQTLERAGPLFGRGVVERIFHGHNPFGPSRNIVSTYTGWLNVPSSGDWELAISSASASFLFLDGQRVLEWPNWHGPVADARFRKKLDLKAGLHRIAYYHVQGDAEPIMVAAWRSAGAERFEIIPPSAFLPPLKARLWDYRIREERFAPDFDWQNISEARCGDRWFVTVRFADRSYPKPDPSRRLVWDFGDGLVSTGRTPSHVYMAQGTYAVTLTFASDKTKVVCRQTVVVDRDWARQVESEAESLETIAPRIGAYSFDEMSGPPLFGALLLYSELERDRDLFRVGAALMKKLKELPEKDACEAAVILATAWRNQAHEPEKAVALSRLAEAALSAQEPRARLALVAGDTYFYDLNQPASARPEYERVVREYGDAGQHVRLALMRLGDIERQLGRLEEARRFYRKSLEVRGERGAGREALDVAMRALETEDFLRRGELAAVDESLNLWQWQQPEEKLRGQWSLLKVRHALATGDAAAAVKEAETLLRVNPESQYVPEVLLLLSDAHLEQGNPDLSRAALERLKSDYPDSPLVAQANDKLEKLPREREPR